MSGPRRILLVAYFYPPCRDTGVLRAAAMAKWLRRLGHEVTVLTTSAYGEGDDDSVEDVVRTADAQRWRARLAGKDSIGAMFDSPTYSGRPHPLSRVLVPEALVAAWLPFARSRALRLHKQRRFDCVITTSPPESAHAVGFALQRRGLPWVADVRDAWTFESLRPDYPTALQRRLDRAARAALARRRRRRRLRLRAGGRGPAPARDRRRRCWCRTAGTRRPRSTPVGRPACSTPSASRSSTRAASAATGATRRHWSTRSPRSPAPTPRRRRRLELVIAGPLTEDEVALFATDVAPARIVHAGSLERARALGLQREADALLLIAQPTRSQLLNIKLFEYLAAGRPILALAAGTEAGRVVAQLGGEVAAADDPAQIAAALARVALGSWPRPPRMPWRRTPTRRRRRASRPRSSWRSRTGTNRPGALLSIAARVGLAVGTTIGSADCGAPRT